MLAPHLDGLVPRSQRCLSGIWWEAGDGDVYVAKDAGKSARRQDATP